MAQVRSWAGLDVHAAKVWAVTVDQESGEMRSRRLSGRTSEVVEFCAGLPGPTRVAYEAGPTGFTLARALEVAGIECVIAAPGKIERPAQDRVKTDRRDAERLVRLLMVDGLHPVRVPSAEEEALRDLVRAREDVRGDLMRAVTGWASCCCATTSPSTVPGRTGRLVTASGSGVCSSLIVARRSRCLTTSARSTR
jgi:transposase